MKYIWTAVAVAFLWAVCSFTYHTLWPSGPGAWTNGVDTSTWWQGGPTAPPAAPAARPNHKVQI